MNFFRLTSLLFIFAHLVGISDSLRNGDPGLVDYQSYYYLSIRAKMTESLSVSKCTIGGAALGFKYGDPRADLQVLTIAPPTNVIQKWYRAKRGEKEDAVYFQTSPSLCSSNRFVDFRKGFYKRSKGCFNKTDFANLPKRYRPVNRHRATLHPDHIRCDNVQSIQGAFQASGKPARVPEEFRELHSYPFMVYANRSVVARSGMISMPCGPFGLFASCEAVKWGIPYANYSTHFVDACRRASDSRDVNEAPRESIESLVHLKIAGIQALL